MNHGRSARTPSEQDVEALYAAHAHRLRRIVSASVRAPEAAIDDACQVAWSRLIRRRREVRPEATLAWLVTTASREAVKDSRRSQRYVSLEALIEDGAPLPAVPPVHEVVAARDRLGEIRSLSPRQQRLVWLQGLGFSYTEMAGHTGASRRTVERQLLRAKDTLRAAA